ncbi:MAG: antibiotic biosynthesis monooxygenase [Cellvibrionaceae bacterium]|nr:antibiotic biosynthesis monooxygenase [Cellvibrionaceae bacterium]
MSKVLLKGYVLASDEDLSGIEAELPTHIELTLQEKGCLAFEVLQDPNNKNKFSVYEEFISKEAFKAHQARTKASKWGLVSANLEKYYHIKEGL